MRLVFLTSTPLSVRGGSGTFVGISVLRDALIALGHQVAVVAPPPGPMPLGHAAQRIGFNLRAGQRLAALGGPVDCVIGFDLDGCLLRHRWPFVASIKGVLAEELTFERGVVRFSLWTQSRFERLNVRRAPLVLTTSQYARSRIAAAYGVSPAKIAVVPEPIDLAHWRAALAAAGDPAAWTPTILTVCHLYPRKSVDVLLRAMTRVRAAMPDARLHVVGVGPEAAGLAALRDALGLADAVTFLGHIPFDQLTREYRDCALFCLPSRQEGFGIVLLEAMAAGRTVVTTTAAAMPEVVPDGVAGRLVLPGDPDALADALIALLTDRAQAELFGRQGACHVAAYDAPRVAERFLEAIAGLQMMGGLQVTG
ncbi:MAG: glycosyltransferase family 4 protein [Thermomicrobiales bacterium]